MKLIEGGAFDDVDAAMMSHPFAFDVLNADANFLAITTYVSWMVFSAFHRKYKFKVKNSQHYSPKDSNSRIVYTEYC